MTSEPFSAVHEQDPLQGVAAIPAVTDEIMNEAAHKAAEAVVATAHSAVEEGASDDAGGEIAADAAEPGKTVNDVAQDGVGIAAATVTDAARWVDASAHDTLATAEAVIDHAGEAARGTGASADSLARYNAIVLDIVQSNVAATTALFTALLGARSVPEAMALNADHLRRQMDSMTAQGRELASLAQKIAFDAMQPIKSTVVSRFGDR